MNLNTEGTMKTFKNYYAVYRNCLVYVFLDRYNTKRAMVLSNIKNHYVSDSDCLYVADDDPIRTATVDDFAYYRVMVPPDFDN